MATELPHTQEVSDNHPTAGVVSSCLFLPYRGFYFFLFYQSRLANSHDRDRMGEKVKGGAFGHKREKLHPVQVRLISSLFHPQSGVSRHKMGSWGLPTSGWSTANQFIQGLRLYLT